MYVVFDEDQGPVLSAIATHDISFPRVILRGVVTTLFTMSVGIGEPDGREPETSIIPISITNARGRMMIFSFGIEDPQARGGRNLCAFFCFLEKEHQDKFLQYSLPIVEVLTNTIEDIKAGIKDPDDFTREAFEQIKRIFLMEIDISVQSRLDRICSEDEISLISDGTIRAIYGFQPIPQLTNIILKLHDTAAKLQQLSFAQLGKTIPVTSQYKRYTPSLNVLEEVDESMIPYTLPNIPLEVHTRVEVHTHVKDKISSYLLYHKGKIALIYSWRRGRIGRLIKPLRDLTFGLDIKSSPKVEYVKTYQIEDNERKGFTPSKESERYFTILRNLKSVLDHYAVYQQNRSEYTCTRIHDPKRNKIFQAAISLFETIDEVAMILLQKPTPQIVTAFSDQALLLMKTNQGNTPHILVGEARKGIGFMRLISQEIENKITNQRHGK
jgi:hypothetical protein